MKNLTELKNIGPKTTIWLHQVGVYTIEDIERLGVVNVYSRLKQAYPDKVSLNALWGLQGAVMGISYTSIPQSIKDELLEELQKTIDES